MDVNLADAKAVAQVADLAFLALPHKTAMVFAKELLALGIKVIDLSADYRLSLETYEKHYCEHIDKEHIKDAVYGLPEYFKNDIKTAKLIANPGCYPTASLLAFASILMTYFGVNFYLSGMHSYATGDPVPIPDWVYYVITIVVITIALAYKNRNLKETI